MSGSERYHRGRKKLRAGDIRRALAELIRLYAPTIRRGLEIGRC